MNRHTMKKTNLLLAAGLLVSTMAGAQTLKLNLAKGAGYNLVTVSKMQVSMEAMGQSIEMNGDTKSTTLFEVKDVRGKETDIAETLKQTAVNFSMMGQANSYDSEKKDNSGPLAEVMGAELNKTYNSTLNEKADVVKADERSGTAAGGAADMLNSMMSGAVQSGAASLFIPGSLGRKLKEGDQWQDSSSINQEKLKMKIAGVFTVKSIAGDIASIDYNGTQDVNTTVEQQGMEITNSGINKVAAQIMLDMKTGLVVERKTTVTVDTKSEVMGMSIPLAGTITVTSNLAPAK
jgi:hypothetical protein